MDWQGEALRLLEDLHEVAATIQRAVLQNDVATLPRLVQREAELANRLSLTLEQVAPSSGADTAGHPRALPEPLRHKARAWWTLHRQNRMLLQHAHQTVVALIGLLAGAAQEPVGLYSPDGARWPGAGEAASRPVATAVDQRV